jgi:ABC-type Fe3+-hydroxamate transport system substrate-binding protein
MASPLDNSGRWWYYGVEVMRMTYPKIALVAEGPKAEELRKLITLVGDMVEAPNLQEALEQSPDLVVVLADGFEWPEAPEARPNIPVVAACFTDQSEQVPLWVRKVRL